MAIKKVTTKKNACVAFDVVGQEDGKVYLANSVDGTTKTISEKTFSRNYVEIGQQESDPIASYHELLAEIISDENSQEDTTLESKPAETQAPAEPTENSMRANREAKKGEVRPFVPARPYLRQSMIKQFEMDPGTFYRKYEDGFQDSTIFTSTGTSVHGVMEDFFNAVRGGQIHTGDDGITTVLYENEWLEVEPFVDHSLTKWWTDHGEADYEWFATFRGHTMRYLNRVIREGLPKVLATEFEFTLEADAFGTPVSGTIDRIDRIDDRTIRIVDYKTNFMPFNNEDLRNSEQFMVYTLACRALKDQLGDFDIVICTYEMVRLGYAQHVVFDEVQLDDFKVYAKMLWQKILSGVDRDFRPNRFTAFSALRDENPAYNEMLHKRITEQFDATDLNKLIEERESIEMTLKTCKVRKDEIDQALKSHIAQAEGELEINGRIYSLSVTARNDYDSDKVIRQLAINGLSDQIPNVVKFSDKQLRDNLPGPLFEQIRQLGTTSYTSPKISSKLKPKEKSK